MGTGGSVFSILKSFYHIDQNKLQWTVVWSKLVNVVSGVPQRSAFGRVIVPPVHLGVLHIPENKLIC